MAMEQIVDSCGMKKIVVVNARRKINSNSGSKNLPGRGRSARYEWQVRTKCVSNPKVYGKFSPISMFTTLPLREAITENSMTDPGNVKVWPNPAQDAAELSFFLHEETLLMISLLDMQGRTVWAMAASEFAQGRHLMQIPLSQLTSGMYILEMRSTSARSMQKVIVE